MALAAAGFFVAALDGLLGLFGIDPSLDLRSAGGTLTLPGYSVLEFLGFLLAFAGSVLLLRHVRGHLRALEKPVLAGLYLLAAGTGLRLLFYLLTFAGAASLIEAGPEAVERWFRGWHSTAVAAAAGAALLGATLTSPRLRVPLGIVVGVAAVVFSVLLFTESDVAGLRDLSLLALAVGLAEAAVEIRRSGVSRFN